MEQAFDVIGSKEKAVAIIDQTEDPKKVAEEIMKKHKNVKSVLMKLGGREGVYRIYELKLIKGDINTEVIHKENGYLLQLDPKKAYFSPRESTERMRIAEIVKPKEKVLVMFSGIGPYAIAISKKKPETEITCVEINLEAVKYAEKNIQMNKISNIKNYCWDVRDARGLGTFDRIIMPLPETALEFLDSAFICAKKGTIIHLYGVSNQKEKFTDLKEKVEQATETLNMSFKFAGEQRVLPFAPRMWKVRLDLKII